MRSHDDTGTESQVITQVMKQVDTALNPTWDQLKTKLSFL
jgi:hypothetical protein